MKANYMRYVKISLPFITVAVLVGFMLAGCSLDRWVEVEPGEYGIIRARGATGQPGGVEIRQLVIDREKRLATFRLVDGTKSVVSFVPRDKIDWPSGCPANIQSTRMEILDLEMETRAIGSITFNNPVLVRNCPRNPVEVVLREDGDIGGAGTACQSQDRCLIFGRPLDR